MAQRIKDESSQWISLGSACRLLGVNETTLRHWADAGRIRTFRTMGGHRRFAREEVIALIQNGRVGPHPASTPDLEEAALRRIRRRLQSSQGARHQLVPLDDDARSRLRVLGRRLVEVAINYHRDRRHRSQLLEEARFIGEEYGAEFARRHVRLGDALESFLFHRTTLVETLKGLVDTPTAADELVEFWQETLKLTDVVLIALANSYDHTLTAETA